MGICSSCLGGRDDSDEGERTRLLSSSPYPPNHVHTTYGAWSQPSLSPQNALSAEETKREQEAMHNIMRWASDQIVEIFPVSQRMLQTQNLNSSTISVTSTAEDGAPGEATQQQHQDILLSMIPGDKSKRSIRIYPASRPVSQNADSVRSKASQTRLNGSMRSHKGKESGVFVKLNVDMP